MKKKLTDFIPIKGAYDVYIRSDEESEIELKRALLGEMGIKQFSSILFKSTVYHASVCAYNAALAYGLYKLLTMEIN